MLHLFGVIPAFATTALLLAMVPGQGTAMLLRQTMLGGRGVGVLSALGNGSGLVLWALLSAFGLSTIFTASPVAYAALRIAGAIFLVGLAIQTLYALRKESGKFEVERGAVMTPGAAYRIGLVTNLTNAKAAVFAVAFIPQFVPSGISVGTGIATLGVVQAITSTSWYMTLVVMVDRASRLLARPPVRRGLTAVSAVGILALAIGLLLASHR